MRAPDLSMRQIGRFVFVEGTMPDTVYLIDNFVNTKPGDPYRLFPFGTVIKNGTAHEITPEYAATFKLPHFKPPIKLGSHEETTPAGGHILSLVVKPDGLYAIPEMTEKGAKAIDEGDYRYHSPEVIWSGGLEDPTTGKIIEGPLIVGDALLHTPHLGEAAALYSIEQHTPNGGKVMTEQANTTVAVPSGLFDRLMAKLFGELDENAAKPAPAVPPAPVEAQVINVAETAEFKALQKERDDYAAKIAALDAERKKAEELTAIKATLQDKDRFGSIYLDLKAVDEAAQMLAGMTTEQREWVTRNFAAFIKQADESKLTAEIGSDAQPETGGDATVTFNAAVTAKMHEAKIDYAAAYQMVKAEKPELFKAYAASRK